MKSSQRIKQGDSAKPQCFAGYGFGDATAAAVRNKNHRQRLEREYPGEPGQDDAAQTFAAPGNDVAVPVTIENDVSGDIPEQALEFGAPKEKVEELRKVLGALKAEEASAVTAEDGVQANDGEAPEPAPPEARHNERDQQKGRSLFRGTDRVTGLDAAAVSESGVVPFTIADLRRAHEKRAKRHFRAKARRSRSGSLLTGLTLMGLIAALMVGLYVMHPQIVAAQPELAPALDQYVETVDRYRALGQERTAEWTQWLTERIGNLTKTG